MSPPSPRIRHFLTGLLLFLLFHYGLGIVRLATSSGGMENKFSALAREKHLSFLLGQNLYVGLAYALLGLVAVIAILPWWTLWENRCQRRGMWSIARAVALLILVHGFFVLRLSATLADHSREQGGGVGRDDGLPQAAALALTVDGRADAVSFNSF
jgi:hypothetical protein